MESTTEVSAATKKQEKKIVRCKTGQIPAVRCSNECVKIQDGCTYILHKESISYLWVSFYSLSYEANTLYLVPEAGFLKVVDSVVFSSECYELLTLENSQLSSSEIPN